MVTIDQFKRGIDTYFTREVFPKLPEGKRFVAAFGTALLMDGVDKLPIVKTLGLVTEDGMIDIERAYTAAKSASNVAPLVVEAPIIGTMRFMPNDIDRLYQLILQ
jgi:hypothetical protein